ncbi:MAG: hypothetical protein M1570_10425 [Chloroflexi bacterium]|nr:hypothetical protein [Chloroflexota bacterium]
MPVNFWLNAIIIALTLFLPIYALVAVARYLRRLYRDVHSISERLSAENERRPSDKNKVDQ